MVTSKSISFVEAGTDELTVFASDRLNDGEKREEGVSGEKPSRLRGTSVLERHWSSQNLQHATQITRKLSRRPEGSSTSRVLQRDKTRSDVT